MVSTLLIRHALPWSFVKNNGALGRALVPGIGVGAALTLIHLDVPLVGLAVFLAAVVVLFVLNPRMFTAEGSGGLVQRTLSDADYTRSQLAAPLILPGATMLFSFALEPADLDPVFIAPLVFVALTASSTWAFLRVGSENRRVGRRRSSAALEKAAFEEATTRRVEAVSTEHGGAVVRGLQTVGAVDGIQVRLWRLADTTGLTVEQVSRQCRELEKLGVVRVSGIDAGDDVSRTLAELTPVGVRTALESRRR